jgi:hypothetical protein
VISRWLCWLLGHGPWIREAGYWHDGQLHRGRECSFCGHIDLFEVIG